MAAYLARRLGFAAVPGVRRVVRVAGADAARAGRLRDRSARRSAPAPAIERARMRATASTGPSARSTGTGCRSAVRFDFGRSLAYDRPVVRARSRARRRTRPSSR